MAGSTSQETVSSNEVTKPAKAPMSTGLKVAIGCGVLLLLIAICGGISMLLGLFAVREASKNVGSITDNLDDVVDNLDGTSEFSEDDQDAWDNAAGVGETVDIDGVEWTLTRATKMGSTLKSTDEWYEDCVSENGEYIFVKATVKNNTTESINLYSVALLDSNKTSYSVATDVYGCMEDTMTIWEAVNPGLSHEFIGMYEVPKDSKELKLQVTNMDLLFTKKDYINLGL